MERSACGDTEAVALGPGGASSRVRAILDADPPTHTGSTPADSVCSREEPSLPSLPQTADALAKAASIVVLRH